MIDRLVSHVPEDEMEAVFGNLVKAEDVAETELSILEEVKEFCHLSRKRHF